MGLPGAHRVFHGHRGTLRRRNNFAHNEKRPGARGSRALLVPIGLSDAYTSSSTSAAASTGAATGSSTRGGGTSKPAGGWMSISA